MKQKRLGSAYHTLGMVRLTYSPLIKQVVYHKALARKHNGIPTPNSNKELMGK